jgi:hypothetical protein
MQGASLLIGLLKIEAKSAAFLGLRGYIYRAHNILVSWQIIKGEK